MKPKLEKILHLFAPTFTLIVSSFILSLIYPISTVALVWIILISVMFILFQFFVIKKKPEQASETSVVLILMAAVCALYLIAPLTKEEMIFGTIMFSGIGIVFIYQLTLLFLKK